MRTRAILILSLALSIGAPAVSHAQDRPAKKKASRNTKGMGAARKAQADKMTGMGNVADENMDPALKGLLNGPDSIVNITKRAEGMSESERETFANEWRAKQAKNLGIDAEGGGGGAAGAPVMSLDELGGAGPRSRLVLGSEQARRDMLLEELRVHARYAAKIERVTELARARGEGALVERAEALGKLEAKRHARADIRIRAAEIDPAAATPAKNDGAAEEGAPAKGGQ